MKKKLDIVYKLTTQDNKTRKEYSNECTWGPGVTHSGTGKGELCGPGYIHAYLSPELAVLLNSIHANISSPKLWECETEIVKTDKGLKVGGATLTTIRLIELPTVTTEQRVIFAILCSQLVFGDTCKKWDDWADNYINGKNRAIAAAHAAARAAARAAASAAAYAAHTAAYAAHTAAHAAAYAADSAAASSAGSAAHTAAYAAAHAAAYAADSVAAYAADSVAASVNFDLIALAKQALSYK